MLESRLEARAAEGSDPSEADVSVLRWQQERFDALTADEPVLPVDTSAPLDDAQLTELVARLLSDQPFV